MPDEGRKKVKVGTRVSAEKLRRNERETKHQMKNNFENLKKGQELESNTQAQKAGKQSPKMSKGLQWMKIEPSMAAIHWQL